MKTLSFTTDALADLRRHRAEAKRIIAKIERYAETGAGPVTKLVGSEFSRLKVSSFRVIFLETDSEITVTRIGPRGGVYD